MHRSTYHGTSDDHLPWLSLEALSPLVQIIPLDDQDMSLALYCQYPLLMKLANKKWISFSETDDPPANGMTDHLDGAVLCSRSAGTRLGHHAGLLQSSDFIIPKAILMQDGAAVLARMRWWLGG